MENIFYVKSGKKIIAIWDRCPDVVLVIDLEKSNVKDGLFFIYDERHIDQEAYPPYTNTIDNGLKDTVTKLFSIFNNGGIIFTTSPDGLRYIRTVNSMMAPRKEFIIQLHFGVEKNWGSYRTDKKMSDLIDFILSR